MDSIEQHPIVKWLGIVIAVLSAFSAIGTVWWYFQDQKLRDELWFQEDIEWNADQTVKHEQITRRQFEILDNLSSKDVRLQEIDDRIKEVEVLINRHWQQREDRFEELERGQLGILESLAKTREAIARHQGHHDVAVILKGK